MRMLEDATDTVASSERIKEALRSVTLTEFSLDGQVYYLKNKTDRVAESLFRALKVKEPANITAREDFKM